MPLSAEPAFLEPREPPAPVPRGPANGHLYYRDIELDAATYRVRRQGRILPLTIFQIKLLRHFILYPTKVFTLAELAEAVWDRPDTSKATVRRSVIRLRDALTAGGGGNVIRTVRQRGYALDVFD